MTGHDLLTDLTATPLSRPADYLAPIHGCIVMLDRICHPERRFSSLFIAVRDPGAGTPKPPFDSLQPGRFQKNP